MNIHMADTACTPCTWVQIIHMMHICMQYIQYSCSRRAEGRKEWEKGGKREGKERGKGRMMREEEGERNMKRGIGREEGEEKSVGVKGQSSTGK